VPKSSQEWVDYFRWNGTVAMRVPWYLGADLSEDERAAIAHSVRVFQLGETSDGLHLMGYARDWAQRSSDPFLVEAIRLLIAEEQRHSNALGRFMDMNAIAKLKHGWTDGVFRCIRNAFGSLEISISVLATAEIIAKVYYPALRGATESTVLHAICEQVQREEIAHVEFQTEQLARMRLGRPLVIRYMINALHRLLFYPTVVVVALSHRRALRAGGLSLASFWLRCRQEFLTALSTMESHERTLADSKRSDNIAFAK
jgi:hypothetical protein